MYIYAITLNLEINDFSASLFREVAFKSLLQKNF
jgi:hypothetical protein